MVSGIYDADLGDLVAEPAKLIVSLNMQLYWGLKNRRRLDDCRADLLAARRAVPKLLKLFSSYGVRATWAPVGFLFCRSKDELLDSLPARLPAYQDIERSPYSHIARIGDGEDDDPCHYAPSLIERIASAPGQEIASHTFANFYCLEEGQSGDEFEADLRAAVDVARRRGIILRSLIFPENQIEPAYLEICQRLGISAYRGNPQPWPYQPVSSARSTSLAGDLRRWLRLLDAVAPITGTRCVSARTPLAGTPVNVPATRRFRPFAATNRWLSALQRRRIFGEMDDAAHRSGLFHLWFPLRDMGRRPPEQLDELRRILDRFHGWRRLGRMESVTMHEVVMGRQWTDEPTHSSSSLRTTSP